MTVRGILPILPLALDRLMRLGSSHQSRTGRDWRSRGSPWSVGAPPSRSTPTPSTDSMDGQQSESLMTVAQPAEDETPAELDLVEERGEQAANSPATSALSLCSTSLAPTPHLHWPPGPPGYGG